MSDFVICESCGADYQADLGCPHDAWLCESCQVECRLCVDDMRDSLDAEEYLP